MKKNIIITGASSGLGKEIGKKFLKEKYNIINISRRMSKNFDTYQCDLHDYNQVLKTIKKLKSKYKNIDQVIFCAGKSNFENLDLTDTWNRSIQDNLFSVVFLFEIFTKIFSLKNKKFIIISSIAAEKLLLDAPVEYSEAKSALNHFGKITSKKIAQNNSSLNIISPGNILIKKNNWDKRLNKSRLKTLSYIKQNVPSNKFCKAEEIFDVIKVLLNKKNNFIGSNIIMDGGQSL